MGDAGSTIDAVNLFQREKPGGKKARHEAGTSAKEAERRRKLQMRDRAATLEFSAERAAEEQRARRSRRLRGAALMLDPVTGSTGSKLLGA
ncbi:MAG TPA: hypothetical protein VJ011_05660 [Steroidobacteraceae bacterium]|nr:hypothetical protein [Steroidobacteraceae bacterium]HLA13467.1 hypothetical protein [Gemmatimonadaceae bacterium]